MTSPRKLARRALDNTLGLLIAQEWAQSIRGISSVVGNLRFERAEVRRLAAATVSASVVTIIPTFRRPVLLQQAVESALRQDVIDHAVIVVSDGEPLEAVLPPDPRLHCVQLARNVGVAGVVRNVGIRLSASRYIAFLDDDNQWLDGHLRSLVEALDEGATFAYSGAIRVLPDGREVDRLSEDFDRRRLRRENIVDINTVAVHRSRSIRFSRRRRAPAQAPGEDWVFVWRRSRFGKVRHLPRCSVRYLINPDSYFWPGYTEVAQQALEAKPGGPSADGE
jgi:glycosyltransferase involved in cell wall biosynthesis